jgi:hypothetical protein
MECVDMFCAYSIAYHFCPYHKWMYVRTYIRIPTSVCVTWRVLCVCYTYVSTYLLYSMCGHALRIQLHTTFVRITSECTYVHISAYPPLCVSLEGCSVYAIHTYLHTYYIVCVDMLYVFNCIPRLSVSRVNVHISTTYIPTCVCVTWRMPYVCSTYLHTYIPTCVCHLRMPADCSQCSCEVFGVISDYTMISCMPRCEGQVTCMVCCWI